MQDLLVVRGVKGVPSYVGLGAACGSPWVPTKHPHGRTRPWGIAMARKGQGRHVHPAQRRLLGSVVPDARRV